MLFGKRLKGSWKWQMLCVTASVGELKRILTLSPPCEGNVLDDVPLVVVRWISSSSCLCCTCGPWKRSCLLVTKEFYLQQKKLILEHILRTPFRLGPSALNHNNVQVLHRVSGGARTRSITERFVWRRGFRVKLLLNSPPVCIHLNL